MRSGGGAKLGPDLASAERGPILANIGKPNLSYTKHRRICIGVNVKVVSKRRDQLSFTKA